ncbi:MAG: hypothetical protein ABIH84_02000 [bacterium]
MNTERIQHVYANSALYLGGGVDSGVCIIPPEQGDTKRYVAHFYKNHLPVSQLNFYVRLTNEASRIADLEQWRWDFGHRIGQLAVRVVPFEEILFHEELPIGISEQIMALRCSGTYETHFVDPFLKLNKFMNDRLGVSGIWIIPFNAQYSGKNGTLFITDLCDAIMNLKAR